MPGITRNEPLATPDHDPKRTSAIVHRCTCADMNKVHSLHDAANDQISLGPASYAKKALDQAGTKAQLQLCTNAQSHNCN
jgi:hypothetical protein